MDEIGINQLTVLTKIVAYPEVIKWLFLFSLSAWSCQNTVLSRQVFTLKFSPVDICGAIKSFCLIFVSIIDANCIYKGKNDFTTSVLP